MSGKKYYLTPNEFSVISAGFEIPMVYGLKQIDGMVDNKEICIALHNMYVNELIKNENSKEFVADDEITEVMRVIKSSERFVLIDLSVGGKLNTICCYHGQKCAAIGEDFLYPDKVILCFTDWEEIVDETLRLSAETAFTAALMDARNGQTLNKVSISTEVGEAGKRELLENYYKEAAKI